LMSEQLKKPPSFMERYEQINNTLGGGTCDSASTRVCLNLARVSLDNCSTEMLRETNRKFP
jgi:hypothetical protein